MSGKKVKITALSDMHTKHHGVSVPKCDICIFAGDAHITSIDRLNEFDNWLSTIPAQHIIYVAGNHDSLFENKCMRAEYLLKNCIYLENERVEIEGIKIYGSPFSKYFNGWSFMLHEDSLKDIWDMIPEDTDILITHGPAWQRLDINEQREYCGSKTLRQRVDKIKPRVHICGHIHESYGEMKTDYGKVINASILDDKYKLKNEPKVIYYNK